MKNCKNGFCVNAFIEEIQNRISQHPEKITDVVYKDFFYFALGWMSNRDTEFIKLYKQFLIIRNLWDKKIS